MAGILRTVARRGEITEREARKLWGPAGRDALLHMVGTDSDDMLTPLEPVEDVHATGPDERLVLTRYGRQTVLHLESICTIASIFDGRKIERLP